MHNALTDNYFVVSLVYSASLGRGGGGSDQTPHAYLPVWCPLRLWATVAPLAQWIIRHCIYGIRRVCVYVAVM